MLALPKIMVAPNGARLTTIDHPALPVTITDIVATAKTCFDAGADGIHAHIRDNDQKHILDAGLYAELIAELALAVPDMQVQITTEAVGKYQPQEQRVLVQMVKPKSVSISIAELYADKENGINSKFYHECFDDSIAVQHILYSPDDVRLLAQLIEYREVPSEHLQILFVLGRYTAEQQSRAEDLAPFLSAMHDARLDADWAICAFGGQETVCLKAAFDAGGKMRIGFENNRRNMEGSIAHNNAERVAELVTVLSNSVPKA